MEILPLISFFTGVISILSPCILPIIPIIVAFSLKSKTKIEIISFISGLLSIFVVIIILTGFFTSLVYRYITYVRILSAVLLLIIGVLMLTDYTFIFKSITPKNDDGIIGSFILGFLTSISWAPCYSAYLISIIGLIVSSADSLYAVLNLFLYCLGFTVTLLILSLVISRINLENIVSKTKYIPKIYGILIIFGGIYLLWESLKVIF